MNSHRLLSDPAEGVDSGATKRESCEKDEDEPKKRPKPTRHRASWKVAVRGPNADTHGAFP